MLGRLGLMCGTFDPPHIGHLILAQTALNELNLDQVLFLPVGDPTHKTTGTSANHRLNMTALAIEPNPSFTLDTLDAVRPEPHYTSTLLPLIQTKYPQADLWLIIGGDSLNTFPNWHKPEHILAQCRLAVLDRPEYDTQITPSAALAPTLSGKIDKLEGPSIELSSTWLRKQCREQKSQNRDKKLLYLVPPSVTEYITENRLYET